MNDENKPSTADSRPAVGGPVQRMVRAPHPERAAFEAWWRKAYHPAPLQYMEDGCYMDAEAGLAWDAWQAARPPRHEIGRLVNLAAECALQKPLRTLDPLASASRIGYVQFGRAYLGAQEALRLMAIELRRVADAL